ncbi:MAG: class I SAM-dependent methyltransferase [Methanomassiliicoccaceae archaeon]|nr:class I SAM-dependent methyltransferase [Methanomassiliicoccaceae archaeon]
MSSAHCRDATMMIVIVLIMMTDGRAEWLSVHDRIKQCLRYHVNMGRRLGKQFGNPSGIAGRFVTFIMNRMNGPLYNAVLNEVGNGLDVLDIGFGNGYMLKKLLKNTDSKFFGIDISDDMVRLAGKKNKKYVAGGRLTLAKASVEEIPFENGFDVVYTINTTYFWNDLNAGIEEIHSKLRDGGVLIIVCYTKQMLDRLSSAENYKKYLEHELTDALEKAGFGTELIYITHGRSFYVKAVKNASLGKILD